MGLTAIEMLIEGGFSAARSCCCSTAMKRWAARFRAITERLAAECSAVLRAGAGAGLAYKTARKGTGNWRIDVTGVAAHAGVDFEKGAERDPRNWRVWWRR